MIYALVIGLVTAGVGGQSPAAVSSHPGPTVLAYGAAVASVVCLAGTKRDVVVARVVHIEHFTASCVKGGIKHGLSVRFKAFGGGFIRAEEESYRLGKLSGIARSWTDARYVRKFGYRLHKRMAYRNGRTHGKRVVWHQNGQKAFVGTMRNGVCVDCQTWSENGVITQSTRKGIRTRYYANGNKRDQGRTNSAGRQVGVWTEWYKSGRRSSRREYGQRGDVGRHMWWFPNGKPSRLQIFDRRGRPRGTWVEWYENGNKRDSVPRGRFGRRVKRHPDGRRSFVGMVTPTYPLVACGVQRCWNRDQQPEPCGFLRRSRTNYQCKMTHTGAVCDSCKKARRYHRRRRRRR